MTKKEILDILYAERNRLMSVYTRPGWTSWALIGSIASLLWILFDIITTHSISALNSISVFYLILNTIVLIGFIKEAFHNDHQPLWGKLDATSIIGAILACLIYIFQFYLLLAYKSLFYHSFFYYPALVFNVIFILTFIAALIMSFFPLLRTQKNNLWAGIVLSILMSLFVVIWGIFIYNSRKSFSPEDIKVGCLVAAVYMLFGCFNISTTKKLKRLDKLINNTLYNCTTSNEAQIFSELEKCMVGIKYGDFLMEENYEYITKKTNSLYNDLQLLIYVADKSQEDKDLAVIVKKVHRDIKYLSPIINNVIRMIKLGYSESDLDPALSPLLHMMHNSLELIHIWLDIEEKQSVYKHEDFCKFILLKKQEAEIIMNNNSVTIKK